MRHLNTLFKRDVRHSYFFCSHISSYEMFCSHIFNLQDITDVNLSKHQGVIPVAMKMTVQFFNFQWKNNRIVKKKRLIDYRYSFFCKEF